MFFAHLQTFFFKGWIAAITMLFIPVMALADFDFNQNIQAIHNEIFNLNLDRAQLLIAAEKKAHPKNAALISCESSLDFYRAYITEEDADFKLLKDRFQARLAQLEKEDEKSPYYLNTQAELILQHGLMRALHNELLGAGLDTRKAFKLFVENHEKFPQFKPTLKGLGLLHIMFGCIPENYKWIANAAGLKGTINQGTAELMQLLSECERNKDYSYLKNETLLILIFVKLNYAKDIPAAYQFTKYYSPDYKSPLINYSIAHVFFMDGKNEQMLATLQSFKPEKGAMTLHYLTYMLGNAKLFRLDYSADQDYLKFINNYKGKNYKKSAYQRLAWITLLKGDTSQYRYDMKQLLKVNGLFTDEDKQAENEAQMGIKPNLILLKARLLFDGGFYTKSLEQLAGKPQTDFPSQRDKIEFVYRTARNFDLLNQKAKAEDFYIKTITIGEKTSYYFAASAALSLAQLYEAQKDFVKAKSYYKKCLAMRSHDYQNSIDQKAKAGLNRVSKEEE
jgi:hypothetical protein